MNDGKVVWMDNEFLFSILNQFIKLSIISGGSHCRRSADKKKGKQLVSGAEIATVSFMRTDEC